ncbi:NusG domain II-containing protein [Hathewaya massiliensis]|uniref:NusG domain II-containing protein n=1 Tax=Hathewaya massiliensis TaxID=1964382 RepID=UPI00163C0D07|nr:NusG domain II-containing protein [Hathewaya massiliensis]
MKRGDKFIISFVVVVFLLSLASMVFYKSGKDRNLIAVVEKEGKEVYRFNITKFEGEKEIKVELHKGEYNLVEIQKGRIRFKDANCSDKVCVRSGWLSRKGDMSICLPHRIAIKILGEKEDLDEVTY